MKRGFHSLCLQASIVMMSTLIVTGCTTSRTNPPPQGEVYQTPWGAVDIAAWDASRDDIFSDETVESWGEYVSEYRKQNPGKKIPYRMLALSGGGSRGAFGAGILSGWTQAGTRPEFDVVTGVSTGALMATPAYLGSEYDSALTLFTSIRNEDIYRPNGKLAILTRQGLFDTTPLKELLVSHIDDSMIDAVAREYRKGRTLFIGTTNLDAKVFTIWDMGKIAGSNHPEKYQLYRDIIMASAAFPIAFPPVYLPVVTDQGETYYQMHADGGIRETVFLYDFLGEFKEKMAIFGLEWDRDIDPQIFLLNNGKILEDEKYRVVEPNTLAVAMRSMYTLLRTSAASSIFVVWASGLANGATVNLAFIPEDYDLSMGALDFDQEKMNQLFQFGRQQSIQHIAWIKREPPKDLLEFRQLINFYDHLNPINPATEIEPARIGLETADDQ